MISVPRFIALAVVVWSAAGAQPLNQRIAAIMRRPEFLHARFGMEFWPLDADRPVYQLNEHQFFVAASTTKLPVEVPVEVDVPVPVPVYTGIIVVNPPGYKPPAAANPHNPVPPPASNTPPPHPPRLKIPDPEKPVR